MLSQDQPAELSEARGLVRWLTNRRSLLLVQPACGHIPVPLYLGFEVTELAPLGLFIAGDEVQVMVPAQIGRDVARKVHWRENFFLK